MTLDMSFLRAASSLARTRPRPVNVYDILREGWRETRVDMTLQFFLDPNERHGLGTLVIDALLRLLDGVNAIGPAGKDGRVFVAEDALGSDAWEIGTQVEYIDVFAVNHELDIAIVLENKIGHVLDNPLQKYAEHASSLGLSTVIVAVLAPDERTHFDQAQQQFLSTAITYAGLSEAIKRAPQLLEFLLAPKDLDQRRSLDLLQQFMEARIGDVAMTELEDEAKRLDEWRDILEEHGAAIAAFQEARSTIGRLVRDRRKRLEPLIAERLAAEGLVTEWEAHGGLHEETWNAYYFPEADWTVELKFSADPARPMIFVYDRRGLTYKDASIAPLGLAWTATDEEITDSFLEQVVLIIAQAKAGIRKGPTT
ncbi:PD-(D/E)XK nuclease family protein [Agromyces sp. Marseille-Q5079]|uniref:PD-(D/E)XK nuclease family protein n=1 Tax=Agromyces sp. Marseille-Q5079 TaxID=3439059 RepID=UPI003D9C8F1C